MRALAVVAMLLAAPVQAMTPDNCKRLQATLAEAIPPVNEIRLAPSVTEDGWCRVIDGPLGGGLEWQAKIATDGFVFGFRQSRLEIEGLGPFELSGVIERSDDGLMQIGPVRLRADENDRVHFSAETSMLGLLRAGAASTGLERASLTVSGDSGLIDDILAWAFRQDVVAARSSIISARDQRDYMLDWLNDEALRLIDPASAEAFRNLVRAYPRARGTAELTIREDRPVDIGGLSAALLFGAPFSRSEAAELIEEAGLRFTWTPG